MDGSSLVLKGKLKIDISYNRWGESIIHKAGTELYVDVDNLLGCIGEDYFDINLDEVILFHH